MNAPLPVKLSGVVTWEKLCEISSDLVNQWPENTPQKPGLCYLHEGWNSAPRRIAWAKPWVDILGQERRGLLLADIRGMNPALESEVVFSGFGDWIPVGEDDAVVLEWESCTSGALLTASKQEDGLWALTYVGPDPAQHEQESMYLLIFMKVVTGARFAAVASMLSASLPAAPPAPPVEYPQEGARLEITPETSIDEVIRFTGLTLLAEAAADGGATSIEFLGRGPDPENMDVYHFYRLRGGRYGAGALVLYSDDDELLWAEPGDTEGAFADQARACGVSLVPRRRGSFRVSSPRE